MRQEEILNNIVKTVLKLKIWLFKIFTKTKKMKWKDMQSKGNILSVRSLELDYVCKQRSAHHCHYKLKYFFLFVCCNLYALSSCSGNCLCVVFHIVDEPHCREELTYSPLTDSFNRRLQWPTKNSCRDNCLMRLCSYSYDPEWSDFSFWPLPLQPADHYTSVAGGNSTMEETKAPVLCF